MKKRLLLLTALSALAIGAVSCASTRSVSRVATEECDIENEGTRKYLETVDYSDDPDYTLSFAEAYYKEQGATDEPRPVSLTWTGAPATRILMSTSPEFENAFEVAGTHSPVKVYNLIPGVKYYYRVFCEHKVLKTGCVIPVGPLRMIEGISDNVRDLGGWKVEGGHIAYGRVYRGAQLSTRMPDSGKDIFLHQLGISVDLDLRGIKRIEARVGQAIEGTVYLKLPVEKNLGRGTGNTQELYQQAIRSIIGWLGEGRNIYFHCAGGADRTGSLAFLIEALLGVSESDLSKDYELTTFAGQNTRLRNFRATEEETHILFELITHLRKFGYPEISSINELAVRWATTRHSEEVDPLTMEEIGLLREYLIVKD
ncbi:MAG: tyrosine-protein phosphatase [Bacteroidales bacterium]|nr:tyrosine-protein phosphatase [Bacteroidales bacterium]